MSIEKERQALLVRLRRGAKGDIKGFAHRARMPYQTIRSLMREGSMGTIKTWIKVEKFFARQDNKKYPTKPE